MAQLQSTSISGSLVVSGSNSKIALGPTSGISRIFTNSTDDIRFSTTNTSDVLFLKNSNGNVGIGTTTPAAKLTINALGDDGLLLQSSNAILGNTGAGYTELMYWNGTSVFYGRQTNNVPGGNGAAVTDHIFRTGGTTRMTVNSAGNVEINNNLTVGGIVTAQEFHTEFVSASIVYSSGSTKFGDTIDDTHSFTGSLEVSGSIESFGKITLTSTTSNSIDSIVNLTLNADSDANSGDAYRNIIFANRGTETARINADGKLSIGTTTAPHLLNVKGTISRLNSSNIQVVNLLASAEHGQVQVLNSSGVEKALINSNGASYVTGDFGIGTSSPSFTSGGGIEIKNASQANLRLSDTSNASYQSDIAQSQEDLYIINRSTTGDLKFRVNSATEVLTITSDARVGIGTTTPTEALTLGQNKSFEIFGTADQTTEFKSLQVSHDGSTALINSTAGGTQYGQKLRLQSSFREGNSGITYLEIDRLSMPRFNFYTNPTVTTGNFTKFDFTSIATNGEANFFDAAPTVNQSGTAGYRVFRLSPYLQTKGSGVDLLMDVGTNSAGGGAGTHTSKFVITGDGDVGIGTTSPAHKLDVAGDGRFTDRLIVGSTSVDYGTLTVYSANAERPLGIRRNGGAGDLIRFNVDSNIQGTVSSNGSGLSLNAGSTQNYTQLFLDDNGTNVGIGTTSPSTKLEVISAANEEGIAIKDTGGNHKYKVRQFGGNTYSSFWNASNSETVRITAGGSSYFNGGNVGIGTTSPGNKLDVVGTIRSRTSAANPTFNLSDNVDSNWDIELEAATNSFKIDQNSGGFNTTALYITGSTGYVGIGTTTPAYKLDVYSSTNGMIRAYGGSIARLSLQNSSRHFSTSVQGSNWLFYDETGGAERMRIDSSGNVGIGTTSPGAKLDVNGGSANGLSIQGANIATEYILNAKTSNGVSRLWVGGTGNVGIGTTTPSYLLDVNGNAAISGGNRLWFKAGSDIGLENAAGDNAIYIANTGASNVSVLDIGTGTVVIEEGGNVGIGTTSPATALHISQSNPEIRLSDSTSGREVGIRQLGSEFSIRDIANNSYFITANLSNNPVTVESYGVWTFKQDTTIEGDLTVDGIVTAQEFHTEFVSASIVYSSGSTKFGDTSDDIHSFTGSLEVLGGITGSIQVPAPSTPSVSAAEASDVINLSISSFDTTADRCEVYRSQTSSTTGFGLIAHIEKADLAASFSVTDDSYTANTQTWYRVYAVRTGKYSVAGTTTVTPSNAVADVSNLSVRAFEEGFIITYDLPADRRLESVTIKKQALAANTGFSEGSATTVYTGLANSYVYVYSAVEKDYYHKFWISTNTAT